MDKFLIVLQKIAEYNNFAITLSLIAFSLWIAISKTKITVTENINFNIFDCILVASTSFLASSETQLMMAKCFSSFFFINIMRLVLNAIDCLNCLKKKKIVVTYVIILEMIAWITFLLLFAIVKHPNWSVATIRVEIVLISLLFIRGCIYIFQKKA